MIALPRVLTALSFTISGALSKLMQDVQFFRKVPETSATATVMYKYICVSKFPSGNTKYITHPLLLRTKETNDKILKNMRFITLTICIY